MRTRQVAMCGMAVAIPSCVLLAGCTFQGDDLPARAAQCRRGPLLSSCRGGQCTMRLRGGSSRVQGRDGTRHGAGLTGVHVAWQPAAHDSVLQEAPGETSDGAKAAARHHKEDAGMQDDTGDEHHTQGGGEAAAERRRAEDFWTGSVRRPWGQAGENTKMGNDEAVRRFKSGACVLVLDFPVEMEFGIDVRSWTVGPKFKGLKMVPAGIHLLYWDAGHGMTQGMWFHARPSQVLIMRWDESIEDFAPTESPGLPAEHLERLVAAVRRYEFDSGLAAYPMEDMQTWRDLTRFLDSDVLAAAGLPIGAHGTSCHVVSGDPDEDAKADNTTTHMTAYFPGPARTARFSCISTVRKAALRAFRHKQNEASANATQCSILEGDESDTLKMLLHTAMQGLPARLLGEVQLAFVCFLLLHSNSAFEYWKLAVSAFCSARRLAVERPSMMHNVVSCMHVELARAPSDWFRDELTQDNFLRTALLNLYLLCSDLREALAPEATSAKQPPASPRRETALCFKNAISAGKGRLLVRKIGALFEFVEEHFSIRVAEWAEGRRSRGTSSQTQFGAGFKPGLVRAFGRKQRSEDMCDDMKASHGSDDVADDDGGLRVERIPVKRHVRGIDDEAKLLCDDDEVGGEEDDVGPYVEYMTRELPLHRTSVCPGEGDGGGGVSESEGEAGMQDVEMELEAETEGPTAMHDQEDKLEDFTKVEGEQAHLLDKDEQRQEGGVDTTRQLEVAFSLIPSLRQTLDQYCSNASHVPDSNPPPSESKAPRQGVAGGFPGREDGKVGGGGRGREARVRQRQVSLPPDLLTNPESVVDGKDGMVIDLRRSNETKLLVAGQEPGPNMVLQLQEYFQRPVSITRITASGGENAARDHLGACHDGARVGQGTTRLEGAIPAGAGFGGDKMDGMRREESSPAVVGEGGGCSEQGHAVHGGRQLAGCRVAASQAQEAEEAEEAGSAKRPWGPIDYSRFNSLDVSDEPERRPYDMCTQCRGPRPAELEIRDENETLLDYVCKQCYNKPRRMEWMQEPPEGWVDPLAASEHGSQPPDDQ